MDKDLGRLHDAARNSLISRRDELIANKGSSSVLKKTRKTISQLDWGVDQYADELDNLMSRGASADEIRSYIRGVEEKALKDFQLLADDSVHHKVQSRTGGDTLSKADSKHVRSVVSRLEQKYGIKFGNSSGPGGNLTADLSLSNYAHKADDRARGLELESGIGKNPNKATTAHAHGTAGYAKNLTAKEIASEDALYGALDRRVGAQIEDARAGLKTDAPRQAAIRDLTGDPLTYNPNATAADIAKQREKLLTVDPKKIMQTYNKLPNRSALKALAIAGLAAPSVLGTAASAAETKGRADLAMSSGDVADWLQTAVSGISLGADFVPGVGEFVSTPADALNVMIDQHRDGGSQMSSSGRGGGVRTATVGQNNGPRGRAGAQRALLKANT